MHTKAQRLKDSLQEMGIQPSELKTHLHYSFAAPRPKHKTLRDALDYRMRIIQMERLAFLLAL
jgi:hypothetical protein